MKKDFTGWHETDTHDLYVEDGIVKRGTIRGWQARPVWPYKRDGRGGWDKGEVKLSTYLRSPAWRMM